MLVLHGLQPARARANVDRHHFSHRRLHSLSNRVLKSVRFEGGHAAIHALIFRIQLSAFFSALNGRGLRGLAGAFAAFAATACFVASPSFTLPLCTWSSNSGACLATAIACAALRSLTFASAA